MRVRISSLPIELVTDPIQKQRLQTELDHLNSDKKRAAPVTIDLNFDFELLGQLLVRNKIFAGLDLDVEFPQQEFLRERLFIERCNIPDEFYFFRDSTVHAGCLKSNETAVGHWTVYREPADVFQIRFTIGELDYTLNRTDVTTIADGDIKRIHLLVENTVVFCDRRQAIDPNLTQSRPQNDLQVAATETGTSLSAVTTAAPISIVVGYTQEVASVLTEHQIRDRLSTCESDLAQSLVNSGINLGLPTNQQIRFQIQSTLVDTAANQKNALDPTNDLTSEQLADELADPTGRFSKLHTGRNGANLVFLLTQTPPYDGQGWSKAEFGVVPVDHIRWGMFHHELGHMVCNYGGSTDAHAEGFVLPGNSCCRWSTIMDNSFAATKINCWSTQSLQGLNSITYTGSKNCARLFSLAAPVMRLLG